MLRKVEESILHPVQGKNLILGSNFKQGKIWLEHLFQRFGLHFLLLGFLLGRASIVGELAPFALPFFAVLYHLRHDRYLAVGFFILLGALLREIAFPSSLFLAMLFFVVGQKVLERWHKGELSYTPLTVFSSLFCAQVLFSFLGEWTSYALILALVEASLSLVLTLIFIQSLPLFLASTRQQALRHEELVCLVILLASVMTGMVGWMIWGLSVEHVLARYVLLVFALAAGGTVGATVGVVTGLILSLAHAEGLLLEMSLLAFSGLLGGMLREGKKIGVALGLCLGTILMGLYMGETSLALTFYESLLAIALFLFTPKVVFETISSYIPGTVEYAAIHQDYSRRVRDVTASKMNQFSQVFQQLSHSFSLSSRDCEEEKEIQIDLFFSRVTASTCQVCFKKEHCWERKFTETYKLLNQLYKNLAENNRIEETVFKKWIKHCAKAEQVLAVIKQEFAQERTKLLYKQKLEESRRLVAEQLSGVSQVMHDFACEIQRDEEGYQVHEQEILDAVEDFGLAIREVEIISLEKGHVQLELSQPTCPTGDECVKLVAPYLSQLLGETLAVERKECQFYADGYCKMTLRTSQAYRVETGLATAAKGGGWLSGDSYQTMEVSHGKYALALADGMGNGERAHLESNETLQLLQQILQSGIEETIAIKSINSVLALRSTEEMFSTLDLAVIDLQTATTKFLKIGSTPSFIKRGQTCFSVAAHNLPMGILDEIEVDVVTETLKAGDLLVMITDGIYDAPRQIENKDLWLKRMISEIKTQDPQEVADLLLEKVVRFHQEQIMDDMTILVAKIEKNLPEWSTIPVVKGNKLSKV